jgi:hypothetical protein
LEKPSERSQILVELFGPPDPGIPFGNLRRELWALFILFNTGFVPSLHGTAHAALWANSTVAAVSWALAKELVKVLSHFPSR